MSGKTESDKIFEQWRTKVYDPNEGGFVTIKHRDRKFIGTLSCGPGGVGIFEPYEPLHVNFKYEINVSELDPAVVKSIKEFRAGWGAKKVEIALDDDED